MPSLLRKIVKLAVPLTLASLMVLTGCGESDVKSNVAKAEDINLVTKANDVNVTQKSNLLSDLELLYPNGRVPENIAAQAGKELIQNPTVLGLTTNQLTSSNSIMPQAAIASDFKPVIRIQNTSLYGAYFFTIYDAERASALATNRNWNQEGPAFWASLANGNGLSPVHRFRNIQNGSYLYTIYEAERASIATNYAMTFAYEGVAWYAQQISSTGWSPLYRFRNKTNGTYLFSAYESEKNAIVANYSNIFTLEGIAYYVRQDVPVDLPPPFDAGPGYGAGTDSCDSIQSVGNPYPCCSNTTASFGNGNCTWYAAYRAASAWGAEFYNLGSLGNARNWWTSIERIQANTALPSAFVHRLSRSVTAENLPLAVIGSIAVRNIGTYGHVAWVTSVDLLANPATVTVMEQNCIHDANRLLDPSFPATLSNSARTRTYSASHFQHYITLAGAATPAPVVPTPPPVVQPPAPVVPTPPPVVQPPAPTVNSVWLYNFDSNVQSFGYGVKQYNNVIAIVNGSNLSQTSVINVSGYSCNVYASLTASNFYKLPFYSNGYYAYLDGSSGSYKYTYPSTSGYANSFAAVCLGNATARGTSVLYEVKSISGSGGIWTGYTTVQ